MPKAEASSRATGLTAIVRSAPRSRWVLDERRDVHQVELVAGEDQDLGAASARAAGRGLAHGVGRALVPVAVVDRLLGGQDVDEAAAEGVEAVGLGDVAVQARAVELGDDEDAVDAGVQAVADRDVDEPELAAHRHRRLGAVLVSGQRRLPWPPPSTAVTASRAPPSLVIARDAIANRARAANRHRSAAPHARRPVRPSVPGAHRRPLRARRGGAAGRALRPHLAGAHRAAVAATIRKHVAGHWQVGSCFDPDQLATRRRRAGQAAGQARPPARRARAAPGAARRRARRAPHPRHVAAMAANFRDKARMKSVLRDAGVPAPRTRWPRTPPRFRRGAGRASRWWSSRPPAPAPRPPSASTRRSSSRRRWRPTRPAAAGRGWWRSSSSATSSRSTPCRSAAARSGTRSPTTCRRRSRRCAAVDPVVRRAAARGRRAALRRHPRRRLPEPRRPRHADRLLAHGVVPAQRRLGGDLRGRRAAAGRADHPPHALRTRLRLLRLLGAADGLRDFTPPARKYAAGRRLPPRPGHRPRRRRARPRAAQKEIGHLVVESNLPKKGQPRSSSYEGEGNVIIRHPETRVVVEALKRLITAVRVEVA